MRRQIDPAEFSELIGAIYDCAIDIALWPETLGKLHAALGFANASLSLMSVRDASLGFNYTAGIPPHWKRQMADHVDDIIAMWGGAQQMLSYPSDRPTVLSQVMPKDVLRSNRYVKEWRAPQQLTDSVVLVLAHDQMSICNLAMGWHRDGGAINPSTLARTTLLIPHLQRAIHIGRLLQHSRTTQSSFEAVIDRLANAVFLIDGDMRIVHANSVALACLDLGDVLKRQGDRLIAVAPRVQQALSREITRLPFGHGRAIGLPVHPEVGGASALHIVPLNQGTDRPVTMPGTRAAIFMSPVAAVPERASETLANIFALTPAETRMLDQILCGRSIKSAATALGIAPSTAKTHLLNIFAKTSVHRQTDIIKLAAAVASPLR